MLLLFWKFTRLRCRDLRVGVRCRRVRLSEVSERPNYRSSFEIWSRLGGQQQRCWFAANAYRYKISSLHSHDIFLFDVRLLIYTHLFMRARQSVTS